MSSFDDPNREAVGLPPIWTVEPEARRQSKASSKAAEPEPEPEDDKPRGRRGASSGEHAES